MTTYAGGSLLLGLAKLFNESHGLALKTTLETSAGASVNEFHQLGGVKVEELGELFGRECWF
jgi:hypothetical protein